jgi:predicted nucleotidyltransferase component of viral defense system
MEAEFPTMLSMPAPHLRAYTRESVIAEKCEAMVKLGAANSRMKDFYDIYRLSQDFEYDGAVLALALKSTFKRRRTVIPSSPPVAFTAQFSSIPAKQRQWQAFLDERELADAPQSLATTIDAIARFLSEPLNAVEANIVFQRIWPKGGPW